jgi:hypothetical protein
MLLVITGAELLVGLLAARPLLLPDGTHELNTTRVSATRQLR